MLPIVRAISFNFPTSRSLGISLAAESVTTFVGTGVPGGGTATPTSTPTRTTMPTITQTRTNTPTPTVTWTRTPTGTITPGSPTFTPTVTFTPSISLTPSANFLTNADMEAGTTGWVSFGAGTLASDTSVFHGGARSLKVTGRTAAWNGIGQNIPVADFTSGQNYTVQVWVRTQTGTPTAKATLRLTAGSTTYISLASAQVNSSGWTLLTGTARVSWTGTLTGAFFYVETAAGTDNFYIDDAALFH